MGHDHHKSVDKAVVFVKRKGRKHYFMRQKTLTFARTGSFLRGYMPGQRSYVVDSGMPPTDLGVIKIEITPKRHDLAEFGGSHLHEAHIHASI